MTIWRNTDNGRIFDVPAGGLHDQRFAASSNFELVEEKIEPKSEPKKAPPHKPRPKKAA